MSRDDSRIVTTNEKITVSPGGGAGMVVNNALIVVEGEFSSEGSLKLNRSHLFARRVVIKGDLVLTNSTISADSVCLEGDIVVMVPSGLG